MSEAERITAMSALLEGTGIALLELTTPDGIIRLRRGTCPPAAQQAQPASCPVDVISPGPGISTAAPSPSRCIR